LRTGIRDLTRSPAVGVAGRWTVVAVATALVLAAAAACRDDASSVTGLVTAVTSSGIDSFSSLEITDDAGRKWQFGSGRFPAFTPSHLREHQISREKVKVKFRTEGEVLVVIDIVDG
jgi:hypothetical protein